MSAPGRTYMTDDTLLDVIDRLSIEHPFRAVIEGRTRWVRRDPLIAQLRDAVAATLTGGNGTAADRARVPFDADALEQYEQLEQQILDALRADVPSKVPHLLPEQNLRAWYSAVHAELDEQTERMLYLQWLGWEQRITAKLHPPVVLELIDQRTRHPFPCPECGMGWFEQILNSGPDGKGGRWYDREKRVALTAQYRPDGNGGLERSAVECGCCGWRVTGSQGLRGFVWELESTEGAAS